MREPSDEERAMATNLLIILAVMLGAGLLGWLAGAGLIPWS